MVEKSETTVDQLIGESQISKLLTESLTKKVIILVLMMLICVPIFDNNLYQDNSNLGYNLLAKALANYNNINPISFNNTNILLNSTNLTSKQSFSNKYFANIINNPDPSFPIINITLNLVTFYQNSSLIHETFRDEELMFATSTDGSVIIIYSSKLQTTLGGILSIINTIFVCFCLSFAIAVFEGDIRSYVIEPLEIIIEIVEKVAKDPINAKNVEDLQTGVKSTINRINQRRLSQLSKDKKQGLQKKVKDENYEVVTMQRAIIKISALLSIGFGEAGGDIIKHNLSSNQELDPMLKGKKKFAIFGFCDIRGFQTINEILQEQTMIFVNEIADLVHTSVDRFGGAANKNIGDAFLCVWKFVNNLQNENDSPTTKAINLAVSKQPHPFKKQDSITSNSQSELNGNLNYPIKSESDNQNDSKNNNNNISSKRRKSKIESYKEFAVGDVNAQRIADLSVISYLSVIIKINKNPKILKYRENKELNSRFYDNFKVNMGFGLHVGWGIEGAIGSEYKMDASYLSPNVNISARLEAATRQYGVSILISGNLYNYLSNYIKQICRLIDVVTVKGSLETIKLYTIDLNLDLTPGKEKPLLTVKENRKKNLEKKKRWFKELELTGSITKAILNKQSFKELLKLKRPFKFNASFNAAIKFYIKGDWLNAKYKFSECLSLDPNDGPTKTLMKYMEQKEFKAPFNWAGFRELTSK